MRKLIVHIEYEPTVETYDGGVMEALEKTLGGIKAQAGGDDADFGWRYFTSLGDAEAWEKNDLDYDAGPPYQPDHWSSPNGCRPGCPACAAEYGPGEADE